MKTVAVDFDGVLRASGGAPIAGARDYMQRLKVRGWTLIIHSCRGNTPGGRIFLKNWLTEHQIPYTSISSNKPEADFYVDNKGIKFTSWGDTLKQMGVR